MKAQDPNQNENNNIAEGSRNIRDNFRALTRTPMMMPLMLYCMKNGIGPQEAETYYGIIVVYTRGVQEKHGAVHLAGIGTVLPMQCGMSNSGADLEELGVILVRAMIAARQFKTVDPITCTVQLRDDIVPATIFNSIFQDKRYENFRQTVATESPDYVTTALGPDGHAELQRVVSATVEQLVHE